MIPEFYDGNFLPDGEYVATWDEVVARFGGNERRKGFCDRLLTFLRQAKLCGFLKVYLFGSFISAKSDPGDVDLLWIHRQNLNYDLLSQECHELLVEYPVMKAREGWDMFCCSDDAVIIDNFMAAFRKDKAPGRKPRGVILLELRDL
jgi:predicted nucleotidyltransferase